MIQIDMEKPNHCLYCPMRNGDDECVLIQEIDTSWDWEEQYANCPLQEVEPECKKGKWIDDGDPLTFKCDKCGYLVARYNNTNFCPNCGSYNGGEQDETD